jgi:hypothetical protein
MIHIVNVYCTSRFVDPVGRFCIQTVHPVHHWGSSTQFQNGKFYTLKRYMGNMSERMYNEQNQLRTYPNYSFVAVMDNYRTLKNSGS